MSQTTLIAFLMVAFSQVHLIQADEDISRNTAAENRSLSFGDVFSFFVPSKAAALPELTTLTVKTRDFLAGATGSIHFILYDVDGNKSQEIELPRGFWKKILSTYLVGTFTFTENSSVPFTVAEANDLKEITSMEVWHTPPKYTYSKQWKPELITIVQNTTGDIGYFPMERWLIEDVHYFFEKYDAVLPQKDHHPLQRVNEINANRKLYKYTQFIDGAPPLVEKMAKDEPFSSNYTVSALKNAGGSLLVAFVEKYSLPENWTSFRAFEAAYKDPYTKPMYFDVDFRSDEWFGRQRLQGIDPTVISLIDAIPDYLDVTEETVKELLDDFTLDEALDENRIFICDLRIMKDLKQKFHLEIPAPTALFYLNDTGVLLPIAIQLMPDKGPDNPVFTPKDKPNTWQLAKFYYNMGEACHHENIMHFSMTHVVTEAIIICTYRNLAQSHPVFRLMKPHFLFSIPINHLALAHLVNPGGLVEMSSNMKSEGWLHYTGFSIANMNYTEYGNQYVDFAKRRVTKKILEDYPYRDDVLLVYKLTRKYVKRVLKIYYKTKEDLLKDKEIQNWRIEMSRSSRRLRGLNLKGVPGDDRVGFTTLDQLIDTITIIIHTSSARHATVNFMQYEWYGYPPNYPLYLKGPIPTSKISLTDEELLGYLAKRNKLVDTMTLMRMLSIRTTKRLGNFEIPYMYHPQAVAALEQFRKDLDDASDIIKERNTKRKVPYKWADPHLIPNAVSI